MRFRTVLFDLDGTLIDHFKAIHRCHSYAMTQLGLPAPTLAQVRAAIGGGLDEAIAKLAGPANIERILPIYTAHWDATNLEDVTALPGASDLLHAVRAAGGQSAAFTNKRGYAARTVCAHLGLTPLLAGIFGAGDTPWLKPQPEFTRHVLQTLGADAATTLVVGDSPYDLAAARNGGLTFIGVSTGTHTADQLRAAGAATVCANLIEVRRELALG